MFPPAQETAESEVKRTTEPETTSGEFPSSDLGFKNIPGPLPTEYQNERVQEQLPINCEAPEPSYEAAITNASSPESTNLNTSSTTTGQDDPTSTELQRSDQGEAGGRPGGEGGGTCIRAGDEESTTVNTAGSEARPAKEPTPGSEEASKRGDTIEPLHEGWQDLGATSGILGSGLEDEASSGIQKGERENGKAEGEKDASVLPLLSKNNGTHEDTQCRVAEEKERRLDATVAEATTNRLGKDW